jgi:hypothetical protein
MIGSIKYGQLIVMSKREKNKQNEVQMQRSSFHLKSLLLFLALNEVARSLSLSLSLSLPNSQRRVAKLSFSNPKRNTVFLFVVVVAVVETSLQLINVFHSDSDSHQEAKTAVPTSPADPENPSFAT